MELDFTLLPPEGQQLTTKVQNRVEANCCDRVIIVKERVAEEGRVHSQVASENALPELLGHVSRSSKRTDDLTGENEKDSKVLRKKNM